MKLKLLTLLLFLAISELLKACSCGGTTNRFTDYIKHYDFVGLIEVIGNDSLITQYSRYSLTKVKIINQYVGKYVGQELYIIDAKGFECFIKLRNNSVGNRFIIKGSIGKDEPMFLNNAILSLSLCDENTLDVNGGFVSGNITANRREARYRRRNFLNKISFGQLWKYKYDNNPRLQTMSLTNVISILREHLEN